MLIEFSEHAALAAEYRRLANGKYIGIVAQRFVGRFSTDDFEFPCADERATKEEAFRDAKQLVQQYSEKTSSVITFAPSTAPNMRTESAGFAR